MKKLILLAMLVATTNAYGYCRYDDNECHARQAEQEQMRRDIEQLRIQQESERRQREAEERWRETREASRREHERKCRNQYGYAANGDC